MLLLEVLAHRWSLDCVDIPVDYCVNSREERGSRQAARRGADARAQRGRKRRDEKRPVVSVVAEPHSSA